LERRTFLRASLAWIGATASTLLFPSIARGAVVFKDTFDRASTSKGWGKRWFNQRRGLKWGISKKKGFFELPSPQVGAGRHNPNPVLLLDNDLVDCDVTATLSSSNPNARYGVMARAVSYGEYYAAYLEGSKIRLSRFGLGREQELKQASVTIRKGAPYRIRLQVTGTNPVGLRAKVWKLGTKEPKAWKVFGEESAAEHPIVRPGATGFLFLHDDIGHKPARIKVDNFSVASAQRAGKTLPRVTFAFAGRTIVNSGAMRTNVVVKTDIPASVSFEVGTDANLKNPTVVKPSKVDPRTLVSKGSLTGFSAGDTIYWRPVAVSKSGRKYHGRIRAFNAPPDSGREVRFCFGSCSKSFATNESLATAAKLNPYFFAHLGDFGYPESALSGGGSMALTAASFQDRWTRMFGAGSMTELHRSAAWIGIQDDHDYGLDNCWSDTVRPFTVGAFDALSGNSDDRNFDLRYGDMHGFFVDTRVHADDPNAPDGPGHSLLGGAQKTWLQDTMRSSDALLLVVFSSQPLWGGGDGLFSWKRSFQTERKELLDLFREVQGTDRRVIVCSGNSHAHHINRFSVAGEKDIIEFVSSGMDRRDTTGAHKLDDDGIIDPVRNIKSVDGFGYVKLKATGNPRVELRAIDSTTGTDIWPGLDLDI
jgi:phosphodiesterase/alkaline phosphatase D-like protein